MAIQYTFYGTMLAALEYFNNRLHSGPWDNATAEDRRKALIAASRIIDTLNFKGSKASVYAVLAAAAASRTSVTDEAMYAAEASQFHEFPRGADTEVPFEIEQATYEIALALLDGRDPDLELEAMGISSQGIESVRTTYARNQVPIEHIINGVPSNAAWRLIRPFLRDEDSLKLIRV